jgi:hypothetical protein
MHTICADHDRAVFGAPVRAVHRYSVIRHVDAHDALLNVDARLG